MTKRKARAGTMILTLWLGAGLAFLGDVCAQSSASRATAPLAPAPELQSLSLEELRADLGRLEAQDNTANEENRTLVDLLRRTITAVERTDALTKSTAELEARLKTVPERIAAIEQVIAAPMAEPSAAKVARGLSSPDAEQALREAEAQLTSARQQLQSFREAADLERQRPEQLRAKIVEARSVLEKIAADRKTAPESSSSATVRERQLTLLNARQRLRSTEISTYEQELRTHNERLSLLVAETNLAQRTVSELEQKTAVLRELVQKNREVDAAKKTEEAEQTAAALAQMPSNIRELAKQNTEFAAQLELLTAKEAKASAERARTQALREHMEAELQAIKQRVQFAGLDERVALALRQQRASLPTLSDYKQRAGSIRDETSWVAGVQIDAEAIRRTILDPTKSARDALNEVDPPLTPGVKSFLLPEITNVFLQRKELADKLHASASRYLQMLAELDSAEQSRLSTARSFGLLMDEHLLWIRSAEPLSPKIISQTRDALERVFRLESWATLANRTVGAMKSHPGLWLPGIAGVLLLFAMRPKARATLRSTAAGVGKVKRDSVRLTLKALGATVLAIAATPAALAALGWSFSLSEQAFDRALGLGLITSGIVTLGLGFLHEVTRRDAIGATHFGWSELGLRSVHSQTRWMLPLGACLAFSITSIEAYDDPALSGSLGRILFLLAMVAAVVFISRVLRPRGDVMQALAAGNQHSLLVQLRYVWGTALIAAPVCVGLLSALGYHYSALQLTGYIRATFWLVMGLILVAEILMRWIVVTERRLAYEKRVAERLEQRRIRREQTEQSGSELEDAEVQVEVAEPEIGIDEIREQSGALVRSVTGVTAIFGMYAIWSSVFPALSMLDEITLWQRQDLIDGVARQVPVTLIDAAFAVLVTFIAWIGTRNLPGALELAVLNRTTMEPGAKYAFTTLCRYVLAGGGIVAVFNILGMEWSQLQWLVAALSVGLGFGLQEIVANFVSGIILLFERPIRVGDVVTVNGTDGVVARIQIRATTLVDFDRKEVVVPNKTFITGEVVNWTLTNATNRIVIPVGVAYGSDTQLALQLLLKAAKDHPRIAAEPEPLAIFEGFGDNTLNLTLRCYLESLDGRLSVISELHGGIDELFKEAGINIAFPQRDLHLDTARPLEIRMLRGKRSDESG